MASLATDRGAFEYLSFSGQFIPRGDLRRAMGNTVLTRHKQHFAWGACRTVHRFVGSAAGHPPRIDIDVSGSGIKSLDRLIRNRDHGDVGELSALEIVLSGDAVSAFLTSSTIGYRVGSGAIRFTGELDTTVGGACSTRQLRIMTVELQVVKIEYNNGKVSMDSNECSGMRIDTQRLREDIETNGELGAVESGGHGRTVLAGTEPNGQARDYLTERLKNADLGVRVDAVGNIVGRWVPESADPDNAPVAAGSHLDSVREGGIFDGPLGVYAALESVRALQGSNRELNRPVEVVCFTEEEGQRFANLLGSSVASGHTSVEDALAFTDEDGVTLEEGLEQIGYHGSGRLDANEWDAYIELHVEQGRRLEEAGLPVGVVTAITGITQANVTIQGEADHAGTTCMKHRTDALAAASEFVLAVEEVANDVVATSSESAVGTVGRQVVKPNSTNVIPGEVRLGVDIRDVEPESVTTIVDESMATLERLEEERGVEIEFTPDLDIDPVPMTDRCREAMLTAGANVGYDVPELASGAGHDPMRVAAATDVGMLFARSRDGISHNPKEWTDWDDCASATHVLAESIAVLATE